MYFSGRMTTEVHKYSFLLEVFERCDWRLDCKPLITSRDDMTICLRTDDIPSAGDKRFAI